MGDAAAFALTPADVASTFCAVAEKAGMGVLIGALTEGAVQTVYISPAAMRIFGHSEEELLRGNLLDFVAEDERQSAIDLVGRVLADEQASPVIQSVLVQQSGKRIPVEVTFSKIMHRGHPLTVNIIVDISERKRLEEQLARADRLAAIGTLAAGVAHEINNPLALVTLNVEMVRRRVIETVSNPDERAAVEAMIADIQVGTARVASIVHGLRAISRDDTEADAPVDLFRVVEQAESLVSHEIRESARVVIERTDLPRIMAGAFRLEQVFANLLVNAAQAFESASADNVIVVRGGELETGAVFIEVVDSGAGIAPDVAKRIFDPFFTTKPVGVGMGLGLSICHGIVARLGGELTVDTALGKGSTFRATFPASRRVPLDAPTHDEAAESALPSSAETKVRARVLVVDDESAIADVLGHLLGRDYDMAVATRGGEALTRIRNGEPYDAILCDLMMPDMTGVDVYEAIAREHPGLERRVVFLSGGAISERARELVTRVAAPRIDKPFPVDDVERALQRVLSHE